MKLLEGKVALVTGAGRGIGKAIAMRYAEAGADVAFTDLVINEAVEQTVAELEAMGVKAKAYASNAALFEETHEVVKQVVADFGRIDVLVNNAGITKDGLMMRMSEAYFSLCFKYFSDLRVPAVAKTPTVPVFVNWAAGLIAGSIPMNFMEYSSLSVRMAAAVAVLQATTIISAPSLMSMSVILRHLSMMNSIGFSPYGQFALSE